MKQKNSTETKKVLFTKLTDKQLEQVKGGYRAPTEIEFLDALNYKYISKFIGLEG